MYGHLTCPEIFWHVSDKRIGLISNPVLHRIILMLRNFALNISGVGALHTSLVYRIDDTICYVSSIH